MTGLALSTSSIAEDADCAAVLVSTATSSEMLESIDRVHTSQPRWPARRAEPASVAALTARELEVLTLVARGMSNKEIAADLVVSVPTIKSHVHNVLSKLGARRRSEAGRLLHLAATTASLEQAVHPVPEPHTGLVHTWDDDRTPGRVAEAGEGIGGLL